MSTTNWGSGETSSVSSFDNDNDNDDDDDEKEEASEAAVLVSRNVPTS